MPQERVEELLRAQTRDGEHPSGLEDVPIVRCKSCCGPQETVMEMSERLRTDPGLTVMTVNMWFKSPTDCAHCVAKPSFAHLMTHNLTTDTLSPNQITQKAVHNVMHACEMACIGKVRTALREGGAAESMQDLFKRMDLLVRERYRGAKGKNANRELLGKIDKLLGVLDRMPQTLPCKSKITIDCADGAVSYSLMTLACVIRRPSGSGNQKK